LQHCLSSRPPSRIERIGVTEIAQGRGDNGTWRQNDYVDDATVAFDSADRFKAGWATTTGAGRMAAIRGRRGKEFALGDDGKIDKLRDGETRLSGHHAVSAIVLGPVKSLIGDS
jgi:hypothetical protein